MSEKPFLSLPLHKIFCSFSSWHLITLPIGSHYLQKSVIVYTIWCDLIPSHQDHMDFSPLWVWVVMWWWWAADFPFYTAKWENSWNCGCFRLRRLSFQMMWAVACKKALEKGITLHHFCRGMPCQHYSSSFHFTSTYIHLYLYSNSFASIFENYSISIFLSILIALLTIKVMTFT